MQNRFNLTLQSTPGYYCPFYNCIQEKTAVRHGDVPILLPDGFYGLRIPGEEKP